jgi:hypothetical protein
MRTDLHDEAIRHFSEFLRTRLEVDGDFNSNYSDVVDIL